MMRTLQAVLPAMTFLLVVALPGEAARERVSVAGTSWYTAGRMSSRVQKLGGETSEADGYARFGPLGGVPSGAVEMSMFNRLLSLSFCGECETGRGGRAEFMFRCEDAVDSLLDTVEKPARDYLSSRGHPGATVQVRVSDVRSVSRVKGVGRRATLTVRTRIRFEVEAESEGVIQVFRGLVKYRGSGSTW